MKAEELIALETALRDLARLYESAVRFTPLRSRAELALLPRLNELGAECRAHVRHDSFGTAALQAVAGEIHSLTGWWQRALDAIPTGAAVTAAVAAFARDDQGALRSLLPEVFAGLAPRTSVSPLLYYGVPITAPRRLHSDAGHFLSAPEVAKKIAAYRHGVEPERGGDWWDQSLPCVALADEVALADSPVMLAVTFDDARYGLFAMSGEPTWRVYTPCLRLPFRVVLTREPADDWWETTAEPYATFRDRLATLLRKRQLSVTTAD